MHHKFKYGTMIQYNMWSLDTVFIITKIMSIAYTGHLYASGNSTDATFGRNVAIRHKWRIVPSGVV